MTLRRGTILLVATTNAGKLKEIRALLDGLPLDVRALPDDAGARGDAGGSAESGDSGGPGDAGRASAVSDSGDRGDASHSAGGGDSGNRGDAGRSADSSDAGDRGAPPDRSDPSERGVPVHGGATPIVPPEETGVTFAENARLKARYYATATGLLTVAEDSGLEIDALDGAPGIWSARYPGETYDERFRNLFAALASRGAIDPAQRTARFVCALALAQPQPQPQSPSQVQSAHRQSTSPPQPPAQQHPQPPAILFEARGTVEGEIAAAPRGTGGFGYDPIFFYPPYGRTLGEVPDADKSRVSHRGAAFRALRAFLERQLV